MERSGIGSGGVPGSALGALCVCLLHSQLPCQPGALVTVYRGEKGGSEEVKWLAGWFRTELRIRLGWRQVLGRRCGACPVSCVIRVAVRGDEDMFVADPLSVLHEEGEKTPIQPNVCLSHKLMFT